MSKTSGKSHRKKHGGPKAIAPSQTSDLSIYLGFLLIGVAVVAFGFLMWPEHWKEIALGYIIAFAFLVDLYAVFAYRGRRMANWQRALARLPLRCAGFGTTHGKPLTAARGAPKARSMIIISVLVSLVVIVGLAFLLIPELLGR